MEYMERTQQLEIVNNIGTPALACRIAFGISRTAINRVSLMVPGDLTWQMQVFTANGCEIKFLNPVPAGKKIILTITVFGESLSVACVSWMRRPGDWSLAPKYEGSFLSSILVTDAEANFAGVPLLIYKEREAFIRRSGDHDSDLQLFFLDLDRATTLSQGFREGMCPEEENELISIISNLGENLFLQLSKRVRYGKLISIDRDHVRILSDIQKKVILNYFKVGPRDTDIHINNLWEAFSKFASGQFYRGYYGAPLNGEPDSSNFFLFAEFAITAMHDPPIDKDFWAKVLPALVGCQRIYTYSYEPNYDNSTDFSRRYKIIDYDSHLGRSNGSGWTPKTADDKFRDSIRIHYQSRTTEELISDSIENAKDAFKDESWQRFESSIE